MVVDVARCRAQKLKPSLAEERPALAHLSRWQEDDARTLAPVSRPCPGYPLLDRCVQMRAEEPKTINGGHGGHALDELLSSTSTVLGHLGSVDRLAPWSPFRRTCNSHWVCVPKTWPLRDISLQRPIAGPLGAIVVPATVSLPYRLLRSGERVENRNNHQTMRTQRVGRFLGSILSVTTKVLLGWI